MADKSKYYDAEIFVKQKMQHSTNFKVPPRPNVFAAANHMRNLFDSKKMLHAFMGGFEMVCLGYRRQLPDLHIAYEDKDHNRLKLKLEKDPRVRLPHGMNPLFPTKILVGTGPGCKDAGCTENATIEVDLLPSGSQGTPPAGMLSKALVALTLKTDAGSTQYKGLDMRYLINTLAHCCKLRTLVWDPRKDLLFLCHSYGEQVHAVSGMLDQATLRHDFLGTALFSRLPADDQRRCYQVLLGQEPPPVMALTPPVKEEAHRRSQSSSAVLKQGTGIQKVQANVNSSPGALLSPPLASKPALPQRRSFDGSVQNLKPNESLTKTQNLNVVEKASRSRYRSVSAIDLRQMNTKHASTTAPNGSDTTHMVSSSHPASHAIAGKVYSLNLAHTTNGKGFTVTQPAQMTPPSHKGQATATITPRMDRIVQPQSTQFHQYQSHGGDALVSPLQNPGQEFLKSQVGLGAAPVPIKSRIQQPAITAKPSPPKARTIELGPQQVKLERTGTPLPESRTGSLHVVTPDGEPVLAASTSANSETPMKLLHVVGPEGVHNAQPVFELPAQELKQSATSQSASPPHAIFELDACPQEKKIIAELATDLDHAFGINKNTVLDDSDRAELDASPQDTHVPAPLTLPSVLMAGGNLQQRRISSPTSTPPSNDAVTPMETLKTNASRYSHYFSPPTSMPASSTTSPDLQPAPLSVYRAYHPTEQQQPILPPLTETVAKDIEHIEFDNVKDVDGAGSYFRTHKRDASRGSHASDASHDSARLALEYQADLPDFGKGYS